VSNLFQKAGWLYLAIFFACFLTFLDRYLYRIGVVPYRQAMLGVLALPIMVVLIAEAGRGGPVAGRLRRTMRGNAPAVLVFGGIMAVSLLWVLFPGAAWQRGIQYLLYVPFYTTVFFLAMTMPALRPVLRDWRVFFFLALLLLASTTAVDVLFPGFFSKQTHRASGTAVNANDSAMVLLMLTSTLLTYGRARLRDMILMGVVAVLVFCTLSRGGLLLYLFLAAAYLAILFRPDRRLLRRTASTLLLLVVVVPVAWVGIRYMVQTQEFFGTTYFARRMSMFSGEAELVPEGEARVVLARYYLDLALQAPILGHGAGHDRLHHIGSPHNMYLQLWVNYGLLGVGLYVALLVLSAVHFARRHFPAGAVFIALVALSGLFTHNLMDAPVFPLMLGVLLSVSLLEAQARRAAASAGLPAFRPADVHPVGGVRVHA